MALSSSFRRNVKRFILCKSPFRSGRQLGRSRKPQDSGQYMEIATGPSPVQPEVAQTQSRLLTLPLEVREMVYEYILISDEPLYGQEYRVGQDRTMLSPDRYRIVPYLDATVLRTCQTIYREALPILYQRNTFIFYDPYGIKRFEDENLSNVGKNIPALDKVIHPYGRLTLIRSMILLLTHNDRLHTDSPLPDRALIWRHWSDNFFDPERRKQTNSLAWQIGFPALENLVLDFSQWRLERSDGIIVGPFLDRFTEFGPLQELTIVGLTQEPTLARLRGGLVKPGGTFSVVTVDEFLKSPLNSKARKEYYNSLTRARREAH